MSSSSLPVVTVSNLISHNNHKREDEAHANKCMVESECHSQQVHKASSWGEFPLDVAIEIAEHIDCYEDFEIFGQVCNTWRHARKGAKVPPSRHTPWLMLAEPRQTSRRQLYNLFSQEVRLVNLPVPTQFHVDFPEEDLANLPPKGPERDEKSDWRYVSTKGWVVCITQLGLNITLVNPSSGEVIQLPCVPKDIMLEEYKGKWNEDHYLILFSKFALSESPSHSTDFILAMIFPLYQTVCIWKNGEDHWETLGRSYKNTVDILFYNNKLYALHYGGDIQIIELRSNNAKALEVINLAQITDLDIPFEFMGQGFLVESDGKLMIIRREYQLEDFDNRESDYETLYFDIWEVDVETGKLNRVNNLGNMAIFVGYNSSFSLEAMPARGCKPNCIYYTDSMTELYGGTQRGGGSDMGVFDLSSGKKEEFFVDTPCRFSQVTPPLWIGG